MAMSDRRPMPSLDGATGWLNSEPLSPAGLRGHVVLVDFWTLHLHQLAAHRAVRPGLVAGVPRRRSGRHRSPHAGVLLRARNRPGAAGDEGTRDRLPGRRRQRLRDLERLRQPLLAGAVLRRRQTASSATTTSAKDATRSRSASSSDCSASSVSPSPVEGVGVEAEADWANLRSPETYLGYGRGERFASPDGAALDIAPEYQLPERLS